jgi:hypothetical protein
MATAGSIVVSLLVATGSFDTDLQRSTKAAEKRLRELEATANDVGKRVGAALGAYFSVQAVRSLISGLDALNDLADATGSSIENLSALEDIAARTGTSFDAMGGAVIKFNQTLKNTDPNSKAAEALEMIGLHIKDLRAMDPAQALLEVAKALAQFADDGNKARLVQELFGKSTREVAAFLKDLADKGSLVATVTTEQAKAAEAFNQQLSRMAKNSQDLARSLIGDLLPAINSVLEKKNTQGFMALFGFDKSFADTKALAGKAAEMKDALAEVNRLKGDFLNPRSGSRVTQDQIDVAQEKFERLRQSFREADKEFRSNAILAGMAGVDTSDAQSRRLASSLRPKSVGVLPDKDKGPKGPDPDADFKQYLNHLQEQIQKVGELTNMEKLLDDIRRGHLTVSPAQEAQLKLLAGEVDAEKEAMRIAKERQAQRNKDYEESAVALREIDDADRQRLKTLMDAGPAAQLERQRKEMEYLAKAFEDGRISAEEFNDAATGYLHLTADSITQTKSLTEELGLTFASAFENAVIGGSGLSDIFKGLLQDIARVILRLEVIEPLMKQLKSTMGSDDGWWNSIVGGIGKGIGSLFGGGGVNLGSVTGADMDIAFAGAMAGGGDVMANRSYWVGEHGPERFVPRTAGAIVPAGAGGGGNIAVINQTSGRVDSATEQRQPNGDRVVILRELAAELGNPNSVVSRAMTSNFNVRRHR